MAIHNRILYVRHRDDIKFEATHTLRYELWSREIYIEEHTLDVLALGNFCASISNIHGNFLYHAGRNLLYKETQNYLIGLLDFTTAHTFAITAII